MAVPKRKNPRSRRNSRRATHDKVSAPNLIPCPNCGDVMVPHRVCPSCGHYKGKEIVVTGEAAEAAAAAEVAAESEAAPDTNDSAGA